MRWNKAAIWGVLVAGCTLPLLAQSPASLTARQIVAHNLRARGGAAAFAAVRSLEFTGHLQINGSPAPLHVWLLPNPNRIRVELSLPVGKLVQGYDGAVAWQIAPGQSTASVLTGDQAKAVQDQALNYVDLMADPAAKVELLGRTTLAGRDCYRLRFTLVTGDSFIQYVDASSWLAFHEEYPGGVEEIGDYRRVQGLLLPFRYVSGPAGQPGVPLVRDTVLLNRPINPALFRKP